MIKLIACINKSWSWLNIEVTRILDINKFGNIVFENKDESIWRICPEELYCELIATTKKEYLSLKEQNEFIEDWEMSKFVEMAQDKFGTQKENRVFCLKVPAILGGEYAIENFGTISIGELIAFSGDVAFQLKDVEDGQQVKFKFINGK